MKEPERVKRGRKLIAEIKELLEYYLGPESNNYKEYSKKLNDLDILVSELSMDQKTYGNFLARKIRRDMSRAERKKGKE